MKSFMLHILEAEGLFYEGKCTSLVIPTTDGKYGVQAWHANTIAPVVTGELTYQTEEGDRRVAAVSNGLLKVEDNDVLVIVEAAEHPEEIDRRRAKRAEARAREELLQKRSVREYNEAQAKLTRALSRLRISERKDWQ